MSLELCELTAIEALRAEAQPIDAERPQHPGVVLAQRGRVGFDRPFANV
jgi:hypothetical protein